MWVSLRLLAAIAAALMILTSSAHAEDLAEAIASRKVSADFEAMGGSSGDVMAVTVKKIDNDGPDIKLTVRSGTRLKSGNADEQDMYLAGIKGILMSGDSYSPASEMEASNIPTTYVLDAYCAEFEKENPTAGGGYALSAVDTVAACILDTTINLSPRTKQAAVWIHTDQATFAQVRRKFQISQNEWKAAESAVRKMSTIAESDKGVEYKCVEFSGV